jgi:hypothetical protein
MLGNSWLAKQLVASQERLNSIELVKAIVTDLDIVFRGKRIKLLINNFYLLHFLRGAGIAQLV